VRGQGMRTQTSSISVRRARPLVSTLLAALGRVAALAGVAALAPTSACSPSKPVATLSASESWCPDGFEVGPQDTCFAVPETTTKETPVLVYLHGMYAGHGSPEEWRIVRSAVSKGFAVVVPRGKRGLCAWKAELSDHFCWPQEVEDPQAFKNVVAEWDRVLWQVDAILEGSSHKRYVLGFSNGGFFAAYLAEHGLFPANAYAIVGAGPLEPARKAAKPVPLMLISAQDDPDQAPKTKQLHEGLAKAGWTHAYCTRPGPHPLAGEDMEAALRFFKHEQEGNLKPTPDGYACEGGTTSLGGFGVPAAPTTPGTPGKKPVRDDR
jgi:poly(3-hydroxybutyrate) depolymerase